MNIYPIFVTVFSLIVVGFGLFFYMKREAAVSLMGSLLCLVGLAMILITIVAWLVPGFFYNNS